MHRCSGRTSSSPPLEHLVFNSSVAVDWRVYFFSMFVGCFFTAINSPTAFGDVYVAKSTGYQFADKQLSNKWHDFFSIEPTQIIRLGDLDGDGKADMFTFMPPPSGEIYAVFSQGDSMTENVRYIERGYAQNSMDETWVGDVNGDGKVDVIVFDRARGTVLVGISK